MTPPPRHRAGNWWHCVVRGVGEEPHRLYAAESTAYPDSAAVELSADEAKRAIGDDATCVVEFDDLRVHTVRVREHFAPNAPPLWFVEHRESAHKPPAVTLVAFTGEDRERGLVLDDIEAVEAGVRSEDQVGAVRWYPGTGEVDQIYVAPQWRRHHIAAVLLSSGNALSLSRGWPRFWGDGQRTKLGEQMRDGRSWRSRFDELTHIAPPMTPGDQDE